MNGLTCSSQAGSPIFICYGTQRISVNLLEFWNFQSHGAGNSGGKGFGSSGGKKGANQQYTVDVAFGICQGGELYRRDLRQPRQ